MNPKRLVMETKVINELVSFMFFIELTMTFDWHFEAYTRITTTLYTDSRIIIKVYGSILALQLLTTAR